MTVQQQTQHQYYRRAFADCASPTPSGPTPLWGPGSIPNNWADVGGFLEPRGSDSYWNVRMHGAFSIPRKTLVYVQTIKVAIMRHGSIWISSIGAAVNHSMMSMTDEFSSKNVLHQKRRISEVMSDHSLSSGTCNHLLVFVTFCEHLYILTKCPDDFSRSNSIAGVLLGGMPQFHALFSCFILVRLNTLNTISWRKEKPGHARRKLSQELAAGGCVERKEEKEERLNNETNEEERKKWKREVEGERERVEIKRIC